MISLAELQQQISLIFSSIIGGAQLPTPKKNYSTRRLWGVESFTDIETIRELANCYYKQPEKRILDAGSLFQRAANMALACTLKIEDEEARLFLLDEKVLPLYAYAHTSFYKFITIPEYQKWHELNINIFKLFFDNLAKLSALVLTIGKPRSYEWNLREMKYVSGILRNKYSAEQAGILLLETAKKASRLNFPEALQLQLYDLALENFATDFYDEHNYPNASIIDNYQEAMKASFALATKLASTEEISAKELQAIQQKMQTMLERIGQLKKHERPNEEVENTDHTSPIDQSATLSQRTTSRLVI